MPINLTPSSIKIGNYTITENDSGLVFDGKVTSLGFFEKSHAQGTNFGYTSSGAAAPAPANNIDKFPFSSDANATDVGDLTFGRGNSPFTPSSHAAGQSSTTSGYTSGGVDPAPGLTTRLNVIDKFPFSTNANATDVGDLTLARSAVSGQSSTTSGYTSGGLKIPTVPTGDLNIIDKFPFSSDANATDVGDLSAAKRGMSGQSSPTHGYVAAGSSDLSSFIRVVERFSFASDGNGVSVGALSAAASVEGSGLSSNINGYHVSSGPGLGKIEKFPFASTNVLALNILSLTTSRKGAAGQSSSVSGYSSGGNIGLTSTNTIDKFNFAFENGSTDVGDLTVTTFTAVGQQY